MKVLLRGQPRNRIAIVPERRSRDGAVKIQPLLEAEIATLPGGAQKESFQKESLRQKIRKFRAAFRRHEWPSSLREPDAMTRPDPELLPQRPRCPRCQVRMMNTDVTEGPEGFEHRTFECTRCGYSETRVIAADPLKSNAAGWVNSELDRPRR
jgi:hypothetical protein